MVEINGNLKLKGPTLLLRINRNQSSRCSSLSLMLSIASLRLTLLPRGDAGVTPEGVIYKQQRLEANGARERFWFCLTA